MLPRWYQTEADEAVWRWMLTNPGNPVLVLPTGAGKSISIAMLCQRALNHNARIVVLQHRKELIGQNAEKIRALLPGVKVGIHSAGLKTRDTEHDVLVAGIQSIYKKAYEIGRRELVIIDESHLLSDNEETMYGRFIADLKKPNPRSRVVGLTATPYRTGEGPICGREKLFSRIAYEVSTAQLIAEGFLCPITNKPADAAVDTSGIKLRGGEFIPQDLERAFDVDDKVVNACKEIVSRCHDSHSVLVFASGVRHAEHVAECLQGLTGQPVGLVTGETFPMERARYLADFKSQSLRWLVNCDVLTTGFDAPCIDAIAVLRATMSPGLFAQIVGRGLRLHASKQNCTVLDFGQNIQRHGSIDDPNYGRASVKQGSRGAVASNNGRGIQCPACHMDIAANSRECPECGFLLPVNHNDRPDETNSITGRPAPEPWTVTSVDVARHQKKGDPGAPPTLRVTYSCQNDEGNLAKKYFSEWVCLEHTGFARRKAEQWWRARSREPVPETIEDALNLMHTCRKPATIETIKEGKYFRVHAVHFTDEIPENVEPPDERIEYSGIGEDVPF